MTGTRCAGICPDGIKRAETMTNEGCPVSEATRLKISVAKTKPRRTIKCSCGCGTDIVTPDKYGRERTCIQGHNSEFKKQGKRNGVSL